MPAITHLHTLIRHCGGYNSKASTPIVCDTMTITSETIINVSDERLHISETSLIPSEVIIIVSDGLATASDKIATASENRAIVSGKVSFVADAPAPASEFSPPVSGEKKKNTDGWTITFINMQLYITLRKHGNHDLLHYSTLQTLFVMIRVKNGYNRMKIADFCAELIFVAGGLSGNPDFPTLQPQVDELIADTAVFQEMVSKAHNGSKVDKIKRDEKRAAITANLHYLGFRVSAIANNDPVIIARSGMRYTTPPQPTRDMVKPVPPRAVPGVNPGEILVMGKKQSRDNGITFFITTTPDDEKSWVHESGKLNNHLFTNLVSGQRYYFRYTLSGPRKQKVVSDIVSLYAQ